MNNIKDKNYIRDNDYHRDEYRAHYITYHLIWCPKRNKKVLIDLVASECDLLIRKKCQEKGWEIMGLEIQPDHVHLFVRAFPTTSAYEIIKECKGLTAHTLRKNHAELLKLPSLWTGSYLASTADEIGAKLIRNWVDIQGMQ